MKTLYDIVIIGSGPGGYRAAILATLRKQKVAIIEKQDWGGCCLNRGCVPKKAWHNTAKLLKKSQNDELSHIGISGKLTPNFNAAWQHQRNTVLTIRDSYTHYMKRLGIDYFEGTGQFSTKNTDTKNTQITIKVNGQEDQTLNTKAIIIATGSSPNTQQPFDIKDNNILTTDDLFDNPPPIGSDVAIIGSGVIAVEFAFILQALGKNIHWFSRSPLLSKTNFSEQAIKLLKEKLLSNNLSPTQALPDAINIINNKVELSFNKNAGDKQSTVSVDWVLLATGRKPHTDGLALNNTNITLDAHNFIKTDQFLQTTEPNIYAIGDVRSHQMTANQAIADANVVVENIINGNHKTTDETWVPQAIYSALEMAKIGFNEDEAEDNDFEPATGFSAFETSPCALGQHDTDGYVRIISDMDTGEFLGGEVVGHNAAEMIQLMALANHTDGKATALKSFAHLSVNHPSRSEELVNASETLANKWGLSDFLFPRK